MLKKFVVLTILLINIFIFPVQSASVDKSIKLTPIVKEKVVPFFSYDVVLAWEHVALCEEGGNWNYFTYRFPNALGITRANWIQFGGSVKVRSDEFTQIEVATRFIQYYHQGIPDQGYCAPW